MTDQPRLLTSQVGRVLTVRFNNPPRHYFDMQMSLELDALTRKLRRDSSVGAIVFTGQDSTYLTHFDVPELLFNAEAAPFRFGYREARAMSAGVRLACKSRRAERILGRTPARDLVNVARIYGSLQRLNELDKVAITAINGLAFGMGCVFALACDIRLMAEDQHIGLPETGLGMLAAAGGTQRLVRTIGAGRALEMLIDGHWLDTNQAVELGLVHRALPPDELVAEATNLAERLARRSSILNREIKRMIHDAGSRTFARATAMEAASLVRTMSTSDARRSLAHYNQWLGNHSPPTDGDVRAGLGHLLDCGVPPHPTAMTRPRP